MALETPVIPLTSVPSAAPSVPEKAGISVADAIALQGVRNSAVSTLDPLTGTGAGAYTANINKLAVNVPSYASTPAAKKAAEITTAANQSVIDVTASTLDSLKATQAVKSDAYEQLKSIVVRDAATDETIAVEKRLTEERNRGILKTDNASINTSLANAAVVRKDAFDAVNVKAAEVIRIENEPGMVGFFARMFMLPGAARELDAASQSVTAVDAAQTSVLAAARDLQSFKLAMLPTKTPEQEQAEFRKIESAAKTAALNTTLKATAEEEQHFNTVIAAKQISAAAAGNISTPLESLSHFTYQADVRKLELAAEGETRRLEGIRFNEKYVIDAEDTARIASALNIPPPQAKAVIARIKQADPDAYKGFIAIAYGGKTKTPEDWAKLMQYVNPSETSAATYFYKDVIDKTASTKDAWLRKGDAAAKRLGLVGGSAEYAKLPPEQRDVLDKQFWKENPLPPAIVNSYMSDIATTVRARAPEGLIAVPAKLDGKGQVVEPAVNIRLAPEGKLGELLAATKGDSSVGFQVLLGEILKEDADIRTSVRQFTNVFKNAVTVNSAFDSGTILSTGASLPTAFMSEVTVRNAYGIPEKKLVDLTKYSDVLAIAVDAKSKALSAAVHGERWGYPAGADMRMLQSKE